MTEELKKLMEGGRVVVDGELYYAVNGGGALMLIGWLKEAEEWVIKYPNGWYETLG